MNKIKLLNYIKRYKLNIILILLIYLVIVASSMSIPLVLGQTISSLETQTVTPSLLLRNFIIVVFLYIVWNSFSALLDVKFGKTNKRIENDIRLYCFRIIVNSRYDTYLQANQGEVLNKLMRDTERLEKSFANIFSLFTALLHSLVLIVTMMIVNVKLALAIGGLFIFLLIIQRYTSKSLNKIFSSYRKTDEDIFKTLKNMLSAMQTIKIYSLEEKSEQLLQEKSDSMLDKFILTTKLKSRIINFNYFVASVFKVTSIFIGGFLYLVSIVTIGQIFTMYSYSIQLANYLRKIIELDIIIKEMSISFERINTFLATFKSKEEVDLDHIDVINSITFNSVNHMYNKKEVFHSLSFESRKGDVVRIEGVNGSGKTTLALLISGLFEEKSGVSYNGVSSSKISSQSIRKRIAYVVQKPFLFPDTILNNMTCNDETLNDKAIEICKTLNVHNRIKGLENGYETVVMADNQNLSGGEKQLVALVRSLVKNSDVLILDEFSSALDAEVRRNVYNNIHHFMENKITFIISHDVEVTKLCNKKISLDSTETVTSFV